MANKQSAADKSWQSKQQKYWIRQIRVAKRLNCITIWAAAIAAAYAFLTLMLWFQSGSHFQTQQKAWVGPVQTIADSFTDEKEWIVLHGRVQLKNYGPSPAFRVYGFFMMVPTFDELGPAMKTACDTTKEGFISGVPRSKEYIGLGITLFPGQELTEQIQSQMNPKQRPELAYMASCFYYRDIWGKTRHTQGCWLADVGKAPEVLRSCPWYNEAD